MPPFYPVHNFGLYLMNGGKVSFLLGEKGKDYHLLKKVIDILSALHGADFSLEDLLSHDFFSEIEKQCFKNIFHQDISVIYAWEFNFYHHGFFCDSYRSDEFQSVGAGKIGLWMG